MNKLKFVAGSLIGLLVITGLLCLRSCIKTGPIAWIIQHSVPFIFPSNGTAYVLPHNDHEEVIVNSLHHTVAIVTASGTNTIFAHDPVIHIGNNGVVTVDRKLFGLEFSPFIGLGYSDRLRVHLGASGLFFQRFDLNAQLAIATTRVPGAVEPFVSLSYNAFGNTSLFLGVNPLRFLPAQTPQLCGGVLVKF